MSIDQFTDRLRALDNANNLTEFESQVLAVLAGEDDNVPPEPKQVAGRIRALGGQVRPNHPTWGSMVAAAEAQSFVTRVFERFEEGAA